MITKPCDRCGKMLETSDELAGRKVTCPACGDVNVMGRPGDPEDAPAAEVRPDRAAAAGLPPDFGPEQRVTVVRRAMIRARPVSGIVLILALLGGVGAGVYYGVSTSGAVAGWAVAGIALLVLVVWKIRTFDESLVITNKRTTFREGLLRKDISEVLHDNIRNVQIHQTFIQRLWGVGEIAISSAGQDGFEIRARDIPHPEEVRRVIDLYRPL